MYELLSQTGEGVVLRGHSGFSHLFHSGVMCPFGIWLMDLHLSTNDDTILSLSNKLVCIFIFLETYRLYLTDTKPIDFIFKIFLMT